MKEDLKVQLGSMKVELGNMKEDMKVELGNMKEDMKVELANIEARSDARFEKREEVGGGLVGPFATALFRWHPAGRSAVRH